MLNKKIFSERLRELRQSKGISTRQLAQALGLKSHGAITQFEKGTALPALDTLVSIADFFEVSIDYLVGVTDFPLIIPDNIKKMLPWKDFPAQLIDILKKISFDNNGDILISREYFENEEYRIKELINGLDEESMLELQKFVRYLHARQSLGEKDEKSAGLDMVEDFR
ncbi:MAG: helix-turn-helix domain-containing protein [Syntrophomonadaceae bacterium]|jgi:transcriptional regulator with XRE-family HTH domain